MVLVDMDIQPMFRKPQPRKVPLYTKVNWTSVRSKAQSFEESFMGNYRAHSVEENWTQLKEFVQDVVSNDVPHKTLSQRNRLPWFDKKAKSLTRQKQKLYNRARKSNTPEDWVAYRKVRSACNRHLAESKNNHINSVLKEALEHNNTKPFWRHVKALRKENVGVAPLIRDSALHSDPAEMADILSDQFESVFVRDEDLVGNADLPGTPLPPIPPLVINVNGILKLLKDLDVSKASGPDQIPNRILKELASYLAPVLSAIFNQSLDSETLPRDWKSANITPVFKKGNRNLASNYRPVSLVSVACKLLEHCVVRHVLSHFDKYNVLTPLQHGFRKGRSCETQLALTIHDLLTKQMQIGRVDIAVLDFSKAFDTVPHKRLLSKLSHYGISHGTNTYSWIKNFLTGRTQRVVVEGHGSRTVEVSSGVPQGTVLGPILFLAFINDLPHHVKSQIRLFADDCLLYRPVKCIEDSLALQRDLASLEKWSDSWGLSFNAQKCHVICTGKNCNPYFYQLNNTILKQVPSHPYLGIELSQSLNFSAHIANIVKKASQKLGFLRRNLGRCPREVRSLAYYALVRSSLEYSASVWDPHKASEVDSLERIQRSAARFACGEYRRGPEISVSDLLRQLQWPPLEMRRTAARLTLFYKAHTGVIAMPLDEIITKADSRTRNAEYNYKQLKSTNSNFSNSFFPRTIREWNALSTSTKGASTAGTYDFVGNTNML